ncbi:hypothetical protein NXS19_002144 [Fusarium pseudograminearum]|nr:hypothetical protein NXS19_002144 [Fusarium pseudograminearum]
MDPDEHVSLPGRSVRHSSAEAQPSFRSVNGPDLCPQHPQPTDTTTQELDELRPIDKKRKFVDESLQPSTSDLKNAVFSSSSKHVDSESAHEVLATNCFRLMGDCLRPNTCGISLPGTHRSAISHDVINRCIPEALTYACTNWATHVQGTGIKQTDDGRVLQFLQSHFLHWLEVLSLTGNATKSINMVQTLQTMLHDTGSERLSTFLKDALQLLYRNMAMIDSRPLQIYSSLLVFASRDNTVATSFDQSIPSWLPLQPERQALEDDSRQILEGHQDSVTSSVFSPDASLIASAADDCIVRIWRVSDGKCLHKLVGHKDAVFSVAFFPKGDIVISGSQDKTIRLWSVEDGRCLRRLRAHNSAIHQVAASPDGRLVAFCSSLDKDGGSGKIWIWSIPQRKGIHEWQGHWGTVHSVDFSPDSELLAFGTDDGLIHIRRVEDGLCLYNLEGHEGPVHSVVFAPDLSYLASSSADGTVRIWDFTKQQCRKVFDCQTWTTTISVSPDSKQVSAASSKNVIQIWNVEQASCEYELIGHNSYVNSVMFSPDAKLLVSSSNDFTVRVWPTTAPSKKRKLDDKFHSLGAIVVSPDSSTIASAELSGSIKLWDFQKGGMIREVMAAGCDLLHVDEFQFSPDGKLLLVLGYSSDSVGWLWSVDDGQCIHDFTEHEWVANTAAFLKDSRTLIIGCDDYVVRRWSIDDGFIGDLLGHESAIPVVSVSNGSTLLVSGDYDGIARLWDLLGGTLLHTLQGPDSATVGAVFSQGAELLAVSYSDNTIRIWNTNSGNCVKILTSTDKIGSVAFSPDLSLLASTQEMTQFGYGALRMGNAYTPTSSLVSGLATLSLMTVAS